ncbi:MAG: class I SAM-dependent methyltransferase [Nitrospiraceae bacterium]|nr:MAG: class I SAM-dependent methyltransferase [Nitrospiraceae bacterium]
MERIPEPDLMDDAEQAEAYAAADFAEPHEAFVRHFRMRFPGFSKGEVLDLGCGAADVIIRFAGAFPGVNITGVDGAQAMLDIGTSEVGKKGFAHRVRLLKCRVPDTALLQNKYDAVISNSLLHHLADPFIMWQTIRHCAKTYAPVFVMDLFRPDTVKSAEGLLDRYAADASPVLRKDFFNSLLAAYSVEEIRQQLVRSNLDYLNIEIVSDRHVLIWGENHEP